MLHYRHAPIYLHFSLKIGGPQTKQTNYQGNQMQRGNFLYETCFNNCLLLDNTKKSSDVLLNFLFHHFLMLISE